MKQIMTKDEKVRAIDICLCVIAFLMARIGVGEAYYTVGVAYVGVLFSNKMLRKWSWLFATCGIISLTSFDVDVIKYLFMFMLIGVIREYMVRQGITLNRRNQGISVALSIGLVNLIATFIVEVSMYRLAISTFEAVVGAGICYILGDGISVLRKNRQTPLTTKEAVSMIFIFSCLLGGFLDVYFRVPLFKEIYIKDICTFVLIIGVIYLGGINIGVTISVVVASLLVMIGYMPPHLSGVYGLAALIGGLFLPLGRIGTIVGVGIGQALGFIIFNEIQMDLPIIGAYLIAALMSLILPKYYFGMAYWFHEKSKEVDEKEHLVRIQQLITERLRHVVGGFEKLAKSFQSLQEKRVDYSPKMLNTIIEETAEKLCESCSMRNFCWQQDLKHTYEQAYEMIGAIEKKGFISKRDIPEAFKDHCLHAQNFAYVLSYKLDLLKQDMIWQNRFLENRALVAEELSAVAETLKMLIKDVDKELYFNKEFEHTIKETICADGIKVKDVMVVENRGKIYSIIIHTKQCKGNKELGSEIVRLVEKTIGASVLLDKHECSDKGCHYKLSIRNSYHISAGSAICAKEGVSGDVHTFMELEDNQYLLALADGMGSGLLAYDESAAAIEMLEDFMESGFRKDLAVKMINAALILKSENEIFSTMDITLIDRQTGIAEFLKAGASTSFILRKGEVITVQGASLPVGMIKEVDIDIKKIQLENGDMIIMVTDGMLETADDVLGKEETFKHFMREIEASDPQYMADYLMQKSKALLGVSERDDMTIVVARVWKDPIQDRIMNKK